jgi:hypothetical protein
MELKRWNTYTVVEHQPDMKVLTGKWVFDCKFNNTDGTVQFQACWVVQGCQQQEGIHYKQTYAAVVSAYTT